MDGMYLESWGRDIPLERSADRSVPLQYSFLEPEFVVGAVVNIVCSMSVSVVLPTEFIQVVSVSKGLPSSSFEFGFQVWFQEHKQTASALFGSYFFCYIFKAEHRCRSTKVTSGYTHGNTYR